MNFKRELGLFDATMVVIGGIIGAGVFLSPGVVARPLDTPLLVLAAWGTGGLIALAGAFSYAELGAIFPKAGGQYVYLRDGLHPLMGFMYGWALLLVIETGAIAAVAIIFAKYALRLAGAQHALRALSLIIREQRGNLAGNGVEVCSPDVNGPLAQAWSQRTRLPRRTRLAADRPLVRAP